MIELSLIYNKNKLLLSIKQINYQMNIVISNSNVSFLIFNVKIFALNCIFMEENFFIYYLKY